MPIEVIRMMVLVNTVLLLMLLAVVFQIVRRLR